MNDLIDIIVEDYIKNSELKGEKAADTYAGLSGKLQALLKIVISKHPETERTIREVVSL